MKTGDQTLVKQINKSIVQNFIQEKCPASRAQISELTGLNKATVSTLVAELINEDLVYEIGPGQSSGGRRPVMLYFNKNTGYSIGIDVGVNYMLAVLTNLNGNIIQEEMHPIDNTSPEFVIEQIKSTVHSLMRKAPECTYGVVGIGIGIPGIVDDHGVVLFAPNLEWKNVTLQKIISEEFQIPVIIENEAKPAAMAEKLYGVGKNVENQIYVSAGIGIGTGIIINNKLYRGASGFSGEMGHSIIEVNGKKCRCGNRGCWERYASEQALLENAKLFLKNPPKDITINLLIERANEGDNEVLQLFNEIGEYLGIGLTNIINTFNPELVVIGNQISKLEEWISNPIQYTIERRALPFHSDKIEVKFSKLGIYTCALGSASFSINRFLSTSGTEMAEN